MGKIPRKNDFSTSFKIFTQNIYIFVRKYVSRHCILTPVMKNFRKKKSAHLRLGRRGEKTAVRLMKHHGLKLIARDWRCSAGELDIVARDGRLLVFAEVKTRRKADRWRPAANLSRRQRERNINAAERFIRRHGLGNYTVRFDLIEVICTPLFLKHIYWHRSFIPYHRQ